MQKLYRAQEGFVNLDSARQDQVEALRSERGVPSQNGKGNEEDRFGKVAASPNSQNLTECGIDDQTLAEVMKGKEFIANASHELRTPITIIRGFAETLHDVPDLPPALIQEITGKILKTSLRLDSLIKSLLALTDIEHLSEDQLRLMDLGQSAENCRQLILAAHPNIHIEVHRLDEETPVLGDPHLLEMAIMNLLENAIKYSPDPAQIEMTAASVDRFAYLKVKDNGIGIPEADQQRIFDRFYSVDKTRSRKLGGSGLGLSIVKTIIQKLNGQVSVVSQLGKGSTFTIQLPAQKF